MPSQRRILIIITARRRTSASMPPKMRSVERQRTVKVVRRCVGKSGRRDHCQRREDSHACFPATPADSRLLFRGLLRADPPGRGPVAMSAASPFAAAMLIAALVGLAALLSNRLGERFPVPVSALFLVGGAVPILLGSFIVHAGVPGGRRAYEIIFVVVAFSVVMQGSAVPALARRLGLPL